MAIAFGVNIQSALILRILFASTKNASLNWMVGNIKIESLMMKSEPYSYKNKDGKCSDFGTMMC